MNFARVIKQTEKHWQNRQGMTVRFERNEVIDTTLVLGEKAA